MKNMNNQLIALQWSRASFVHFTDIEEETEEIVQNQGERRVWQSRFGFVRRSDADAAVQAEDVGFGWCARRRPKNVEKSFD